MSDPHKQSHPSPPEAPDVPRRVNLSAPQIVAVILLSILPVLSILGVFGESQDSADASGADIRLRADYPSRLRFLLDTTLQVTVENAGQQALDTLMVHFERDYIDQFVNISFVPPSDEATDDAYVVEVRDLAPGDVHVITAQFQGSHYGRHTGKIWVSVDDQTAAELEVSSVVFP